MLSLIYGTYIPEGIVLIRFPINYWYKLKFNIKMIIKFNGIYIKEIIKNITYNSIEQIHSQKQTSKYIATIAESYFFDSFDIKHNIIFITTNIYKTKINITKSLNVGIYRYYNNTIIQWYMKLYMNN